MHSFMVLATAAALIVTGTAVADAAPTKKKTQASDRATATAVKQKPGTVSRSAAGSRNRPYQRNQGWPTSVNDGSFSYGFGPGGSLR